MTAEELSELSDQELLEHARLMKKTRKYDAFIMGFLVGVALFASVRNGLGLLTFLPLVYPPIAARNHAQRKQVTAALQLRGLKLTQ